MKTTVMLVALCFALGYSSASAETPRDLDPTPVHRVGVYDSRAVAYAYFWSDAGSKPRNALMTAARAAKAAGEHGKFARLNAELLALQKRNHLQVFSTAPAEEALAYLEPRLSAVRTKLGVERLVSKWDAIGLAETLSAERVDVTDALVREYITPTPRQADVLRELKRTPPLSLPEAERLANAGKL